MAASTALSNALDATLHGAGNAEELISVIKSVDNIASLGGALTSTATELNQLHSVTAGTVVANKAVVVGANKNVDTMAFTSLVSGSQTIPGSQGQAITVINRKTGIADNTATSIFTVTCPNGENAAVVELVLMATVKKTAGGTYESTRVAVGYVVFDRTTGAALVGTATTLTNVGIATSGTDTLTLSYSLSAVVGSVGNPNTIDIQVTCVGSGTDTHLVTALATIINSEASGMTLTAD